MHFQILTQCTNRTLHRIRECLTNKQFQHVLCCGCIAYILCLIFAYMKRRTILYASACEMHIPDISYYGTLSTKFPNMYIMLLSGSQLCLTKITKNAIENMLFTCTVLYNVFPSFIFVRFSLTCSSQKLTQIAFTSYGVLCSFAVSLKLSFRFFVSFLC